MPKSQIGKSKIRVLYVVSTLARTGPVQQLCNLVKYLDLSLFEPVILTLSPEPKDSLWDAFCDLGVSCYTFGLSRIAGFFLAASRLKRFLRRHPVDIVHSHGLRADMLSAVSFSDVYRISTRRETFYKQRIIQHGPVRGRISEFIHSAALQRLDRIVCCSESVRQTTPAKLMSKTTTIRNGVDDEKLSPVSFEEKLSIRKRLGLPLDVHISISVGHLSDGKDPITIIRAFLTSPASDCGLLVFLGDGPLRMKCQQLANSSDKVVLAGFVSNVVDYLQAADLFISASLSEGLPGAAIEACACGLPLVLSDIGPHHEIMELSPDAGLLFPLNDVRSLADCLSKVINTDYASRSEAALSLVRNHLNGRKMSADYQALYIRCYGEHTNETCE